MSATITTKESFYSSPHHVHTFEIDWTNDASGVVSGNSIIVNGVSGPAVFPLNGSLLQIKIVGTSSSSNVTLKDDAGVDMLGGLGAGVTGASVVRETPLSAGNLMPFVLDGKMTFAVAGGTANESGGRLVLMFR